MSYNKGPGAPGPYYAAGFYGPPPTAAPPSYAQAVGGVPPSSPFQPHHTGFHYYFAYFYYCLIKFKIFNKLNYKVFLFSMLINNCFHLRM